MHYDIAFAGRIIWINNHSIQHHEVNHHLLCLKEPTLSTTFSFKLEKCNIQAQIDKFIAWQAVYEILSSE